MATVTKLTIALILGSVLLQCCNARPISDNPATAERPRRQTLGNSEIAGIMQVPTAKCPIYVDGQCDKIQDIICTQEQIINILREQVAVQSVEPCQFVNLNNVPNNIRSLQQDFKTLVSVYDQVVRDGLLPQSTNTALVQCQLNHINSYLNDTIDRFCEENCSTVINVSCDSDIDSNSQFVYTRDNFTNTCSLTLLNSLQVVLAQLNHQLTSYRPAGELACAPASQCFRATSSQEERVEAFKMVLRERQRSLPSSLTAFNGEECRPAELLEACVFDLYKILVSTAHQVALYPSQNDLTESLNSTILPLLRDLVTPVVMEESELQELSIVIPSADQAADEEVEMTSCLVTRLSVAYEALVHDQLRHQWTIINRGRATGCSQ